MRSLSVIVADADMDKLSRLVRALKYSLFRDQQQLRTTSIKPGKRRVWSAARVRETSSG